MRVSYPDGTTLSASNVAPGALSGLVRDGANNLVGHAVLRPVTERTPGVPGGVAVALGGLALIGLTAGAIALVHARQTSRRALEAEASAGSSATAPAHLSEAGWFYDTSGKLRWWDGSAWGPLAAPASPAPGWYEDSAKAVRWWDGTQWTGHTLARPAMAPIDGTVARPEQRVSMTSEEWTTRARAASLADAFSREQWQLLASARISDGSPELLGWQHELRRYSPEAFVALIAQHAADTGALAAPMTRSEGVRQVEARVAVPVGTAPTSPAGWYQVDTSTFRWWDGARWTRHYRALQP